MLLGYLHNNGNSIQHNVESVGLYLLCSSRKNSVKIIKSNFLKTVALFCARKSIKGNWFSDKDNYLRPTKC